jgi:hypothetical protein
LTIDTAFDNLKTLDVTHSHIEYLSLDPSYIDTAVGREIGITGQFSYVEEEVKG